MPRQRGSSSAVTVTTTSETVVATLPGVAAGPSQPVDIEWALDFSTGTGVTAVTVKVERGTAAGGTVVQTFGPFAAAASTRIALSGSCTDAQAGEVSNQQYVVTATQAGATGNGTSNFGYIFAVWG